MMKQDIIEIIEKIDKIIFNKFFYTFAFIILINMGALFNLYHVSNFVLLAALTFGYFQGLTEREKGG